MYGSTNPNPLEPWRRILGGLTLAGTAFGAVAAGVQLHREILESRRIYENAVYTLPEAARVLRLQPEDVLALVEERTLTGRRIGDTWCFLGSSLLALVR